MADRSLTPGGRSSTEGTPLAAPADYADHPLIHRRRHEYRYHPSAAQRRAVKDRRASDLTGGFTLLEAVIALALMGIILGALATISSQWLPNWNRGIGRLQREEQLALALERPFFGFAAGVVISPRAG